MQRSRTSYGSLLDSAFDPFAEEDGYVPGKGRKRPRFSMRSNEWRVVDESESPQEDSGPVDWMDIVEREASEEEVQSEAAAEDIDTTEIQRPVPGQPSSPTGYRSAPAPTIQLPSEHVETAPETNVDQFARSDFLRPEAGTGEITHGQAPFQDAFDAFIHLPTETPRLHPIPSPGLPVPSPLVPSGGQTEYFSSFTSSTQQTSPGRFLRTETQTAAAVRGPTEEQHRPLPTQAIEAPQTITGSAAVDEYPGPLPSAHPMEASPPPGDAGRSGDFKFSSGAVGNESYEGEEEIDEGNDSEAEPDESAEEDALLEEGSVDQEDELSGEEESEGEVYGAERHPPQQSDLGHPEVIEIDSGESGEEEVQDSRASQGNVGREHIDTQYPVEEPMEEDRVDDFADEDEDEDEDESEDELEDEMREGEFEHVYDNEEVSYDSGGHPDEYADHYESELESEDVSDEEQQQQQQQPPPRQAEPEVIVLDSDSDEEPAPKSQARPTGQLKQESSSPQDLEQPEPSEDEYSSSDADSVDYEDEEAAPSFNEEHVPDEPSVEESEAISHAATAEWPQQGVSGPQESEPSEPSAEEHSSAEEDSVDYGVEEEQPRPSEEHAPDELPEDKQTDDERVDEAWDELVEVPVEATTGHKEQSPELMPGLREPQLVATGVRHPAEQTLVAPEPAFQSPIDPGLSQVEETTGETVPLAASEPCSVHADVVHERLHTSGLSAQASEYTWLDGAASPRPGPASAGEPLPAIDNQQLATPDYSQEVEAPTTHATEEIPFPSEQAVTSVEHLSDTSSLVTQEERVEIKETPASKRLASRELIDEDETPRAVNRREMSSEASERYLRSHAPNRNAHGLRSKLAYFAPLATLVNLFNSLTDTISIVCETPSIVQAKIGKKDHILTVHVTDKSMGGNTMPVQIIRPYKSALPTLSPGVAVLLRNFRVKTVDHAMVLVSENTSAWAVFHSDTSNPEVTGPPVEYGAQECAYATDLRQWYQDIAAAIVADNQLHDQLQASVHRASLEGTPASDAGLSDEDGSLGSGAADGYEDSMLSSVSRSARRKRKSHRRITIHELRDGRRYAEAGSPSSRESIHELRDGTVYANL